MPVDREEDRRVAQDGKVEGVVRVFPDVLAAEHEILAEGLLQAGMELVAVAGLKRAGNARCAGKQRGQHVVQASLA
jgi:hypothetical protein